MNEPKESPSDEKLNYHQEKAYAPLQSWGVNALTGKNEGKYIAPNQPLDEESKKESK